MFQLRGLALLLIAVSGSASAAIGPAADLTIANLDIEPDGSNRACVCHRYNVIRCNVSDQVVPSTVPPSLTIYSLVQ